MKENKDDTAQFKVRDARTKQFFRIDDEYLNGYARLCGINATGVYAALCRHANKHQSCFPSKKLMAEELAISERSVYSALKKLQEWNVIRVEDQGRKDDGSFNSRVYVLLDKSVWKKKPVRKQGVPSANGAVGKKRHAPQANDDIHRRHVVPNKETHPKETHIRESTQVDESYIEELKARHPKVNVTLEWEKASDFILATGRKYKNERAFFRNWLRRVGDFGVGTGNQRYWDIPSGKE